MLTIVPRIAVKHGFRWIKRLRMRGVLLHHAPLKPALPPYPQYRNNKRATAKWRLEIKRIREKSDNAFHRPS